MLKMIHQRNQIDLNLYSMIKIELKIFKNINSILFTIGFLLTSSSSHQKKKERFL